MDNVLHLIGIAKKAGRLEVGEEPVGAAARSRQAKIILLAADAAENSARRARHYADAGNVLCLQTPYSKAELGQTIGRSSCAMLALTDAGLASSLLAKLAVIDAIQYGEAAIALQKKAEKVLQRQKEKRIHEKNLQRQKARPWASNGKVGAEGRLAQKRGGTQTHETSHRSKSAVSGQKAASPHGRSGHPNTHASQSVSVIQKEASRDVKKLK